MQEASRMVSAVIFEGDVSSPTLSPAQPGIVNWNPEERWLRDRRPRTRDVYERYMARFLAHTGFKTPLEFLGWARSQQDPVSVEEVMQGFVGTIPKASRGTPASALKTFLEKNGYRALPKDFVTHFNTAASENRPHYRGFTREEVQRLLSYLDNPLQKLFVYFQKDTGFRVRTTLGLVWHHIKDDYDTG